jgi:hypothetical protein
MPRGVVRHDVADPTWLKLVSNAGDLMALRAEHEPSSRGVPAWRMWTPGLTAMLR